jgi:hypothetical protein
VLLPFALLGHFILIVNATAGSIGQRFTPGVFGGIVRANLTIVVGISSLAAAFSSGRDSPPSIVAALLIPALILGPVVSFAVLFVAYRRARDTPAAQEEQAERLVNAWLAVGIGDAIGIVIALFAALYAWK